MNTAEQNKALVTRFMETFSAGDAAGVYEAMDPDGTWWVAGSIPLSGTYSRAEFRKLLEGVGDVLTGPIKLTPKHFTAEGNRVAVEAESLAHTQTGKTYNNHYHLLFEVKGDKILRIKEYLDTVHANEILCTP